jgi:rhodanese-related sulfurtransferase
MIMSKCISSLTRLTVGLVLVANSLVAASDVMTNAGGSCATNIAPKADEVQQAEAVPQLVRELPISSSYAFERKAVTSCFVHWPVAKSETRRLVDVRSKAAHAKVSILGSVNIPAETLRHRDFLRNEALLLIDDGKASQEMQRLCETLSEAGFKDVRALYGGLRTIHAHGESLVGSALEIVHLATLSSAEFHLLRQRPEWKVVGIGEFSLGAEVRIDAKASRRDLPQMLMRELASHNVTEQTQWIVVGLSDGERGEVLKQLSPQLRARTVFFSAKPDEYAAFIKQQNLIVASAGQPLVRPCTER